VASSLNVRYRANLTSRAQQRWRFVRSPRVIDGAEARSGDDLPKVAAVETPLRAILRYSSRDPVNCGSSRWTKYGMRNR
jgi:hypothetical protein